MIATMISEQDVEKLAALARIKLSPTEKEALVKDMESILGYVKKIHTASPKPIKSEHRNVMRIDSNPHESGAFTERLLNEAPAREGTLLKVKKIL